MPWRAYLPSLLAILIWAGNTIINRMAAKIIDPAAISFVRWLIAGVLLSLLMARPLYQARHAIRPHLGKLFTLGLLGMVAYQCLAYQAAHTTTATNMGLITALVPLFAAAFALPLLGERPAIGTLPGGLISLTGLAVLLSHGQPGQLLDHGLVAGDGLMLLAAMSYALYGVLIKRWSLPLDLRVSLCMQILTVLPVLAGYYSANGAPAVPASSLPLILYAGIPASVIAPWLWMRGLATLGPARASSTINLMPVFITVIAMVFLGEMPQSHHLAGGALALLGVVVAQQRSLPGWLKPAKATG